MAPNPVPKLLLGRAEDSRACEQEQAMNGSHSSSWPHCSAHCFKGSPAQAAGTAPLPAALQLPAGTAQQTQAAAAGCRDTQLV